MKRIEHLFQSKLSDILTIYFTAGYPKLDDTVSIITALDNAGVDLIEIGIPYSDPLADGQTIQKSSQISLKNGMNLNLLFMQLTEARKKSDIPMVMMGYYNQVLQYGIESFCQEANSAGVDGLIIPDLPLKEYYTVCKKYFDQYNLSCTFLITPSSSDKRILALDQASSGFLYAVSSHSITGGSPAKSLEDYGQRLSTLNLTTPIQVGFGIKDSRSFETACSIGQGGIIGSAFIEAIAAEGELQYKIKQFIQRINKKARL